MEISAERPEDPAQLAGVLSGWQRALEEETAFFRSHGVETVCDAACGFGAGPLDCR